jgi:hypothetical protein
VAGTMSCKQQAKAVYWHRLTQDRRAFRGMCDSWTSGWTKALLII